MAHKPCLTCGRPTTGPCCSRRPLKKTAAETTRRRETVAAWRLRHGDLCPGYQRDAHQADPVTNPLTADHALAVDAGGDEHGPLEILCRACNSAKRDGRDRARTRRWGL